MDNVEAAARIRGAKPRTDTYDLCTDPDLVAEYEGLLAELGQERESAADSFDGGARAPELQEQLAALQTQIAEATVTLTMKALPRPVYRRLVDEHPPVKDESGEIRDRRSEALGVDYDAFFDAVLRRSLVAPELDAETLTYLVEELLSAVQWRALASVLNGLNEREVDIPFSLAALPKTPASSPK